MAYENLCVPKVLAGEAGLATNPEFDRDLLGDDIASTYERLAAEANVSVRDHAYLDWTVHISYGDVTAGSYLSDISLNRTMALYDAAALTGLRAAPVRRGDPRGPRHRDRERHPPASDRDTSHPRSPYPATSTPEDRFLAYIGRRAKGHVRDPRMKAAIFGGPRDIVVGERPDPGSRNARTPSSASPLVASAGPTSGTTAATHRTRLGPIGHELSAWSTGRRDVGPRSGRSCRDPVHVQRRGCACAARAAVQLPQRRLVRQHGMDGGQGEAVRVPFADATLVKSGRGHADETLRSMVALSDVACTGHHAAVSAGVGPGDDGRRRR